METFTDPRDGETYKIVKIGNLVWFAENLKYQGIPHSFPGRDSDNLQKYGCLYTWVDAMKACPKGWRLPTNKEFEQLLIITGADCDASSIRNYTWEDGFNSSGFNVLPSGMRGDCASTSFYHFGTSANFWSVTPCDNVRAYRLYVYSGRACMSSAYVNNVCYSVRCVKEV